MSNAVLAFAAASALAMGALGSFGCAGAQGPSTSPVEPEKPPPMADACEHSRAAIAALYRAEAHASGAAAARIDEATRDNTVMVLAECAQRPDVATCASRAATAAELERQCLAPLPEDGSEARLLPP